MVRAAHRITWRWFLALITIFASVFVDPIGHQADFATPDYNRRVLSWGALMLIGIALLAWEGYLMGRPWAARASK